MIKSVSIKPWCIACKNCESICPSTFKVNGKSMVINHDYKENIAKIIKARDMCPVQVIQVDLEDGVVLNSETQKWKILAKNMLTPDTLELIVATKDFSFRPGQYVTLQMKDKIWIFTRSYSIASGNENSFSLTIKLLENGRGAKFLQKKNIWDKIEFFEASGHFVLQNTQKPKVFIATGTGLAPMIAMLENTPEEIQKTLIFWVRFEQDFYYLNVLKKFKNLKIITTVSQASPNYSGNTGRVTDYLDEIWENSEVYICGNPNMVESVEKALEEKNFPKENIFAESFVASPVQTPLSFFENYFIEGNLKYLEVFQWFFIILGLATIPLIQNGPMWYYMFSWDIAWWSVTFLMLIRPLADLFPKYLILRRLVILRKWLGILSSAIVLSHLYLSYNVQATNFWISVWQFFAPYLTLAKWEWMNIFARLSEFTAIILLVTSNNISQKLMWVWWKRIQKLSYIYFVAAWMYIASFGSNIAYYCIWVVILLTLAAFIKKKI